MAASFPALAINTQGEGPLKEYAQIEQIMGARQSLEMGKIQLQEAKVSQQSQQTLMTLFAKNDGDYNKTIADAQASGKVTPDQIMSFQTHAVDIQTKAALKTKADLENEEKTNDILANNLESFKQTPVAARTPEAVKAMMGTLSNQGIDISKYIPAFQQLAKNPSDETLNTIELGLKGRQWAIANEKAQREESSAPTVAQAQQKMAAELSKAVDESQAAHIALLSMPTPAEASTKRMADLRETQSKTALNNVETATKKVEMALMGANPVKAFDPSTQQWVMAPMAEANSKGYTNQMKLNDEQVTKEMEATKQFNVMESSISTYKNSLEHLQGKGFSEQDAQRIGSLLSDKGVFGGHIFDIAAGLAGEGRAGEMVTELEKAKDFRDMSPEARQATVDYLRARTAVPLVQKALTGVGRMNEAVMKIDMGMIPTPLEAASAQLKLEAFQKTLDLSAQGVMRIPGLPTPKEVRQLIETKPQLNPALLNQLIPQGTPGEKQKSKDKSAFDPDKVIPLPNPTLKEVFNTSFAGGPTIGGVK